MRPYVVGFKRPLTTRGLFEEGLAENTLEGCYIGGIYAKERPSYDWKRKCCPNFSNSMINTVNWLKIRIEIDGEDFSMSESKFSDYRRELDMKQGLLKRKLIFTTKSGKETLLCWERFVSHHDRHCGAIRLSIKALNHNDKVKVTFMLDGEKENRDVCNNAVHSQALCRKAESDDTLLLIHVMSTGQYYINRMLIATDDLPSRTDKYFNDEKVVGHSISFRPEEGVQYNLEKITSIWTSREAGYPHGLIDKESESISIDEDKQALIVQFLLQKSKDSIMKYSKNGFDHAKKKHLEKISSLWNNDMCDIEICGDDAAQQGIRYSIFQLLGTYAGNDSFLNIGAKGYTGENRMLRLTRRGLETDYRASPRPDYLARFFKKLIMVFMVILGVGS